MVPGPTTDCSRGPAIGPNVDASLSPMGTDSTFDLASWNMENFPMAGEASVSTAARVMGSLRLDLWAVQEIGDTSAFRDLVSRLPGYQGLFSPDVYSFGAYQKTGLVWRADVITVHSWRAILQGDYQAFPRPPIEVDLTAHQGSRQFHARLIVLHLKAGSSVDDASRRRQASAQLHAYLGTEQQANPGLTYLVAGDWNAQISDSLSVSSLPDFIGDPDHYQFLDVSLLGHNELLSHPGSGRMLDHILVNRAGCAGFDAGTITTLRLHDVVDGYFSVMSDHVPVFAAGSTFR